MNARPGARRGFTVVELLVCVGALAGVGSISAVSLSNGTGGPPEDEIQEVQDEVRDLRKRLDGLDTKLERLKQDLQARDQNPAAQGAAAAAKRQLKDSTQIRGIEQSMILWAQNNRDEYPLPSRFDVNDKTVREKGAAKDTSANIMSMLIYNGSIPAEICVSPAEANPNIGVCSNYEFDKPKGAMNREQALWDPSFSVDFTKGKGNLSYAHMRPDSRRLGRWSNTFNATDAQVGNRGPEIAGVESVRGKLTAKVKNPDSNTYLIHGPRESWEGNIGYADCHVSFETTLLGDDPKVWDRYEGRAGPTFDCYFYDEPDDVNQRNIFMSIFTKAGADAKDWTAIWD